MVRSSPNQRRDCCCEQVGFLKTRAERFVNSISIREPVILLILTSLLAEITVIFWQNNGWIPVLWCIKCNEVALYPDLFDQYDICSVQPSLHARTVSEDDPESKREKKILRRKAPIYWHSRFHATRCTEDGWREILAPILGAKWRNGSRCEKGEPRTRLTYRARKLI